MAFAAASIANAPTGAADAPLLAIRPRPAAAAITITNLRMTQGQLDSRDAPRQLPFSHKGFCNYQRHNGRVVSPVSGLGDTRGTQTFHPLFYRVKRNGTVTNSGAVKMANPTGEPPHAFDAKPFCDLVAFRCGTDLRQAVNEAASRELISASDYARRAVLRSLQADAAKQSAA